MQAGRAHPEGAVVIAEDSQVFAPDSSVAAVSVYRSRCEMLPRGPVRTGERTGPRPHPRIDYCPREHRVLPLGAAGLRAWLLL